MAGNAIQVNSSTGAIKVKNNGIVVAGSGDPCCCEAPGVACTYCTALSSSTPASVTITIENVTICGCTTGATTANFRPFFNPNGTYTLTQLSGSPCIWGRTTTEASAVIRTYTTSSCTTEVDSSNHMQMELRLDNTTWKLHIFNNLLLSVDGSGYFFHGTASATDCSTNFSINNAASGCGNDDGFGVTGNRIVVATGGTASISL